MTYEFTVTDDDPVSLYLRRLRQDGEWYAVTLQLDPFYCDDFITLAVGEETFTSFALHSHSMSMYL